MAGIAFSLFAGGLAQRATVAIDGRTEILPGPSFSFASSGAPVTQTSFQQIDFPGRVLTAPPFGDPSVATLTINDRPAGAASPFDVDGDGRIDTVNFTLNPAVSVSPQIAVTAADADLVTLSGWPTVNLDLADQSSAIAFDLEGAREGLFNFGAADDALTIETGSGTGLLQVASGSGDDAVDLTSSSFYSGTAQVALGDGDDTLRIARDDGDFRILATSSGAETAPQPAAVADTPVSTGATSTASAANPTIFPPVGNGRMLDIVADGGAGADRFTLSDVSGRVSGGAGADIFEVDRAEALTIQPGAGADTVVLRNGASATIEIARADTGTTASAADTLRFSATSVSSSTVELSGFAPGSSARIVPDAPLPTASFQPVQHARLFIDEPGAATPQLVELIGVNTDPVEGLTVLFT
ncbi:MAG TPA: hypothetical protein VHM01_11030 [Alphaproteobacteria bacterium]|nr:hypothetical protein [Alphaproteobacteria bacterium]